MVEGKMVRSLPSSRNTAKPKFSAKGKSQIVFSTKDRMEFLNGFSARKDERKRKGNLKNLKKERQAKREEQTLFKQHVNTEYTRARDAVVHNLTITRGDDQETVVALGDTVQSNLDESRVFYPSTVADEFGDVSVQVTCLESPQFAIEAILSSDKGAVKPKDENRASNRATDKKKIKKATIFNPKRRRKETRKPKESGLKRVKKTVKAKKSKKHSHSRT